jgi:hypothetical protein
VIHGELNRPRAQRCLSRQRYQYTGILGIWQAWAPDLHSGPFNSGPFNSGHHMAEENPGELVRALRAFPGNS